jgi:hypothetical protein
MPLSKQDQLKLLGRAKEDWLDAQKYQSGYKRAFAKYSRMSGYLRQGTFASAMVTIVVSALGFTISAYPGIAAAMVTGIVTGFDQTFNPVQSAQKNWESSNELDEILRELTTYAISIETYATFQDGLTPLAAIQSRLKNVKKLQVILTEDDENYSNLVFSRSQLYYMLFRLESPITDRDGGDDEEEPREMVGDANNVIAAVRGTGGLTSVAVGDQL